MTQELLTASVPVTEPELDPLSDRYRVCPNCQTPHMVRNKGRDFCSDRCADQHYNARRRLMKQAEPKHPEVTPTLTAPLNSNDESAALTVASAQEPVLVERSRCEQILDDFKVPHGGALIPLQRLIEKGFDFDKYTSRTALNSSADERVHYKLTYGIYSLHRLDPQNILVAIIDNSKLKSND